MATELGVIGVEILKNTEVNIRKGGIELNNLCKYHPEFKPFLMRYNAIWREMDTIMQHFNVTPLVLIDNEAKQT